MDELFRIVKADNYETTEMLILVWAANGLTVRLLNEFGEDGLKEKVWELIRLIKEEPIHAAFEYVKTFNVAVEEFSAYFAQAGSYVVKLMQKKRKPVPDVPESIYRDYEFVWCRIISEVKKARDKQDRRDRCYSRLRDVECMDLGEMMEFNQMSTSKLEKAAKIFGSMTALEIEVFKAFQNAWDNDYRSMLEYGCPRRPVALFMAFESDPWTVETLRMEANTTQARADFWGITDEQVKQVSALVKAKLQNLV